MRLKTIALSASCLLALLVGTLLLPGCADERARPGFKLVWADEFDGDKLDESAWGYELGYIRNQEIQYYTNDPKNVYVKDGSLHLVAIPEKEGSEHRYTSASVNTHKKKAFRYGRFEIKAKLPDGTGVWPAFWMMGDNMGDSEKENWPATGEIDIMEMFGREGNDGTVYANLHFGETTHLTSDVYVFDPTSYALPQGETFNDAFHVFALEWDEQEMRWYVDDNLYYKVPLTYDTMGVFHDKPFYILLNLAIGGVATPEPTPDTVMPAVYEIQYVRVYEKT